MVKGMKHFRDPVKQSAEFRRVKRNERVDRGEQSSGTPGTHISGAKYIPPEQQAEQDRKSRENTLRQAAVRGEQLQSLREQPAQQQQAPQKGLLERGRDFFTSLGNKPGAFGAGDPSGEAEQLLQDMPEQGMLETLKQSVPTAFGAGAETFGITQGMRPLQAAAAPVQSARMTDEMSSVFDDAAAVGKWRLEQQKAKILIGNKGLSINAVSPVNQAASGKLVSSVGAKTGVSGIATNTVNAAKTKSLLSKLITPEGMALTSNAIGTAGVILTLIGTYPFAGFIKEESLQTIGLATTTAMENGLYDEAQAAQDFEAEVLKTEVWEAIISAVPVANIGKNLLDYYEAARHKHDINQKALNRRLEGVASPFQQQVEENREAGAAEFDRRTAITQANQAEQNKRFDNK